ncbi:MAG: L-2-amino-thiazoline-4-carboxylic acid hydrolase [Solobacterium sp.]|nr:L-2-amino-thiazoline-4-carboxylic acid hydrolase [Solobacterium sp.]
MPLIRKYRKIISRMAGQRFPAEVQTILEETGLRYDSFRKSTPDIGGRANMQFKDLDFLIAFFAFYEACDRRIGIPELEEFAYEAAVRPSEAFGKFINWNSPLMAKITERIYARFKKKTDAHTARGEWGNTWRIEMNPEGHTEGFAIHTRMCPITDF